MNEDILKGKWHEIQGDVKKTWGKLTDDDVMVINGESEKLLGFLQTKYGYEKDKAQKEYDDFINRHKQHIFDRMMMQILNDTQSAEKIPGMIKLARDFFMIICKSFSLAILILADGHSAIFI